MAETFTVSLTIDRDDEGVQRGTFTLPKSCPEEEEEPTPTPSIPPPPAPLSVLAASSPTPSLRINVTWPNVTQATGYEVQKQNVTAAPGVWVDYPFFGLQPSFSDTGVVDTIQYAYRVRAFNHPDSNTTTVKQYSAYTSSATVTADDVDPTPPPVMTMFDTPVPTNITGLATGTDQFTLGWTPVTGATQYKVYADFTYVMSVNAPTTSLVIGSAMGLDGKALFRRGNRYRVSAVVDGLESFVSAPCHEITPNPGWDPGATPGVPSAPICYPVWQGGDIDAPRNLVFWKAPSGAHSIWDVYRDGVLVEADLFVMYYVDDAVTPGVTYQYKVVRKHWRQGIGLASSAQSAGTNCVTRTVVPPTIGWTPAVTVVVNDDSVIFRFNPCAGAKDYRVYPTGTMDYKYRGMHDLEEVEFNGISQDTDTSFTIEALEQWGPFQQDEIPKADPHMMHINGQGDPSSVPSVLATTTFTTRAVKRTWTGNAPIFLDCFYVKPTFTPQNGVEPEIWTRQGATFHANDSSNPWVQKAVGINWIIRQYIADRINTRTFHGHGHIMDALFDGGAWIGDPSPPHNNNATWLMEAVQACVIPAAPECLHCTFEVDAHFNSRRWCGLLLTPLNDPIIRPAIQKLEGSEAPTESGDAFAWEIEIDIHKAWTFHGTGAGQGVRRSVINSGFVANQDGPGPPGRFGRPDRTFYNATYHSSVGRALNGPANFLDRRQRFDLIINTSFFRVYEEGIWMAEGTFAVPLDFNNAKMSLTHHVYHTANDIDEIVQRDQDEFFWVNMRSYDEVRHWDNQGFRKLATTPANTQSIITL